MLARVFLSLVLCSVLGCGSNARAPVEDRTAQSQKGAYTVKRGDTLYSIAFRSGMDFRKVAVANGITAPYTIYPGQTIQLREAISPQQAAASPATAAAVPLRSHGSSTSHSSGPEPVAQDATGIGPPIAVAGVPSAIVAVPSPVVTPTVTPVPTAVQAPEPARPVPATVKQSAAEPYTGGKVNAWRWPTGGPVTRGYSESVHKGIDIGGARGDPIVAVAAGKVVYGGTGIVGFGELLIIKHNEEYLSAYGHNNRLLVTEGQTVTAGQIIAEKGSSGTDTVKLHFEIRKEGKPVDPQRLLPQR